MRLDLISQCHFLQRLQFRLIRWFTGTMFGPIVIFSFRRELYGKYLAWCFQDAMRKMKHWSKGEVELFAAFVSDCNHCRY